MGSAKPVEVPRDFLARMGVLLLCVAVAEPFSLRSADSTEATPQHGAGSFMHFIANSVNASADPCQDFFQFACGSYVESTPYLPHLDSVSVTDQMEEKLRLQLNELLAEPASDREPAAFEKAKALYRSCVNTTLLEEKGLQPARDILSAIGGWPLLELEGTWDESKFDWKETMYKLVDMGLNGDYLFSFGLGLDIRNTSKYIIEVGMPNFNLDLKALDEAASLTAFQNYVREMRAAATMLMKSESPSSSVTQETMLIALFEIDLNSRTKSLEDRRNLTLQVNHMSLSALQERYPFVPWMEYIRRVLPTAANITVDEIVNVADIEFMDALGRLLAITHKRTLANYLVWRTLEENVLPYLDSKARAVFVQGKATRSGRVGQRWDECVKLVQQSMQLVTSAMYVRRHSSTATRASARKMVLAISQEMHRLLQSVDWMDSHTRRAAIQKADVMGFNVAFPDELLNDTMLDEQFQGVEISADRLLDNVLRLQRDAHLSYARLFHTDYKKEAWAVISGYVDVVNAFYAHGANSLSIPAGILNGAFFEKDRPQHVNFGAIGFIIGHEISHGFDETGSLFNANGVMEDWWDDETKQRFDEKVRCVVQQYSSLRSEAVNVTVNGVLTQSENIADNAALKLAYSAYHRHVASHGAEAPTVLLADGATSTTPVPVDPVPTSSSPPALSTPPALVLSARQMFWVAFASVWCSKQAPEKLNIMLRTSSHLPGVHRVNGAVRNQEAFAADFGCPQGSPMNPVHKCQVW